MIHVQYGQVTKDSFPGQQNHSRVIGFRQFKGRKV